jgi:hypothetical protein
LVGALKGDLQLPKHIIDIFKKGSELSVFKTFELESEVEDVNKFGVNKLSDQEKQDMLSDLAAGKVSSFKQLNTRNAELTKKINSLAGTSITEGPEISIPFLGVPIPLGLFGVIGGLLNVILIVYLLRLLTRLKDSLTKARNFSEHYDVELFRAITAALPFVRIKRVPSLAISVMILIMPSLISALLLMTQVKLRVISLIIVTFAVVSAAYLAYRFAAKAHLISESSSITA